MNCDSIHLLLNARLDGELAAAEWAAVERHLAACPACQSQWHGLQEVDRVLTTVLKPTPADERARQVSVASLRQSAAPRPAVIRRPRLTARRSAAWALVICLSLAMFLLLRSERLPEAAPAVAGRVVNLAGTMELRPTSSAEWRTVSTNVDVVWGAQVRTGTQTLCELQTIDHSRIRLGEHSELIVHGPRRIELRAGTMWCASAADVEVLVTVPQPDAGALSMCSMACPSSSEFQWSAQGASLTCASGESSTAELHCGPNVVAIAPQSTVTVDAQQGVISVAELAPISKVWQLPLLATQYDELQEVLRPLLASLGRSKAAYLTESQIRQLGPAGAVPLLAFVETVSGDAEATLRQAAMQLAVEIADRSVADELKRLRDDRDPIVRKLADDWFAED